MGSWFDGLLGKSAIPPVAAAPGSPAITPTVAGPAVPLGSAPTLPLSVIRDPRWERRLTRLLQTKGSPTVADYAQVVLAALALNQFQPEDFFPDEQLAIGFGDATAGAGEQAMVNILNPAGSAVLGIVEDVTIGISATDIALIAQTTVSQGGGSAAAFRDTRLGVPPTQVPKLTTGFAHNNAPVGIGSSVAFYRLTNSLVIPLAYILVPGQGLVVQTGTVGAKELSVVWRWREIPLPVSP